MQKSILKINQKSNKLIFVVIIFLLINSFNGYCQLRIFKDTLNEYSQIFNPTPLSSMFDNISHKRKYLFSKKIYIEITQVKTKDFVFIPLDYHLVEAGNIGELHLVKYYSLMDNKNISLLTARSIDSNFVKLSMQLEANNFFFNNKLITCFGGFCYSVCGDEVVFYDEELHGYSKIDLSVETEYTNKAIDIELYENKILFIALDKASKIKDDYFQRIYVINISNNKIIGYTDMKGVEKIAVIDRCFYIKKKHKNKIIYLKYGVGGNLIN